MGQFLAGFFSSSRRINRRIVNYVTVDATMKMRKMTSKMLNKLFSGADGLYETLIA